MTKKEKIRMATQIADAEIIIMTSSNSEEVRQAKDKVINLTNKIERVKYNHRPEKCISSC